MKETISSQEPENFSGMGECKTSPYRAVKSFMASWNVKDLSPGTGRLFWYGGLCNKHNSVDGETKFPVLTVGFTIFGTVFFQREINT
jgi:hypothetical protein